MIDDPRQPKDYFTAAILRPADATATAILLGVVSIAIAIAIAIAFVVVGIVGVDLQKIADLAGMIQFHDITQRSRFLCVKDNERRVLMLLLLLLHSRLRSITLG